MSLPDVLAAREARMRLIEGACVQGHRRVVTLGLNLPGGAKCYPFAEDLLNVAIDAVERELKLKGIGMRLYHRLADAAGPFAFAIVDGPVVTEELKMVLIKVEESHPLGSLFDLDVLVKGRGPVSRNDLGLPLRRCLVCNSPAHICRRMRAHDLETLKNAVFELVESYNPAAFVSFSVSVDEAAFEIGEKCTAGMLFEAATWPAPGLVSPRGPGSHRDMNYWTFLASSAVLSQAFGALAAIGLEAGRNNLAGHKVLARARVVGYNFEQKMFGSTGGVNTHRGLLFLLGLAAVGAGCLLGRQGCTQLVPGILNPLEISAEIKVMVGQMDLRELGGGGFASEKAFKLYSEEGLTGPRGEAARGLPSVIKTGLPALKEALGRGYNINDSLVHALISLMSIVEDTALAGRHGVKALRDLVWPRAREVLAAGSIFTLKGREKILHLQEFFDRELLNPGGSADLVAVSCALYLLENLRWSGGALGKESVFKDYPQE